MTLDPRIGFFFSLVALLVGALLTAGAEFTGLFGPGTAATILGYLAISNSIVNLVNMALHAIPSKTEPAAKIFYLARFGLGKKRTKRAGVKPTKPWPRR